MDKLQIDNKEWMPKAEGVLEALKAEYPGRAIVVVVVDPASMDLQLSTNLLTAEMMIDVLEEAVEHLDGEFGVEARNVR